MAEEAITIKMTARKFAGIVIKDGIPESTVEPELLHSGANPPNRVLIAHTQPQVQDRPHPNDIIIELKSDQRAEMIDSKTNKPLFELVGDTSQDDTGTLRKRLDTSVAGIMQRVHEAIQEKNRIALTELGFHENEIDTMLAVKHQAAEQEVAQPAPHVPGTGPGAPGASPLIGEKAQKEHAEHEDAVRKERERLGLKAPNQPEPMAQQEQKKILDHPMGLSPQHADAVAAQARRAIKYLETHPNIDKPKEESTIDPNAPQDRGISVSDMERISSLSLQDAQNDPKWNQLKAFLDSNGNGIAEMGEIVSAANLALQQGGITHENANHHQIISGLVAKFDTGKLSQLPDRNGGR